MAAVRLLPRTASTRFRLVRAIYLAQTTVVSLSRVVAYAWVLSEGGISWLPWIFLVQALPLSLVTFVLLQIVDRVGRATLLAAVAIAFLVLVASVYIAASCGVDDLSPFFLLMTETVIAVLGVHFWLMSTELLSPEEAREQYPRLAAAGALGAVFAGIVAGLLPPLMPEMHLIVVLPPLLLLIALALFTRRLFGYRLRASAVHSVLKTSFLHGVKADFHIFRGSRLLTQLALLSGLITCAGWMVDLLFNAEVERLVSAPRIPAFLGLIQVVINLAQLAFVGTFGARFFVRAGLFPALKTYPMGISVGAFVGMTTSLPFLAVGLKVVDRVANYVLINPALALVLNAFPFQSRGRATLLIGGLVKPAALACAGLLGIWLGTEGWTAWLPLMVLAPLMIVLIYRLNASYTHALIQNLEADDHRLVAASIEALAEPGNKAIVPVLLDLIVTTKDPVFLENALRAAARLADEHFEAAAMAALWSPHVSVRCAAAAALAAQASPRVNSSLIAALRREESSRVKAQLLSALKGRMPLANLRPFLLESLADSNARVCANAVEVIGIANDPPLMEALIPLLEHPSPRVAANAIVALGRHADYRPLALEALQRMFQEAERQVWASAIYAVGEVGDASFLPILELLLASLDPLLRRNAAIALGKRGKESAVPTLVAFLTQAELEGWAVARAFGRYSEGILEQIFAGLAEVDDAGRAHALRLLRGCGVNYADAIAQIEALRPKRRQGDGFLSLDVLPTVALSILL